MHAFLVASAAAAATRAVAGATVPVIRIPACEELAATAANGATAVASPPVLVKGLALSSGAGAFPAHTEIGLCWTPHSLVLGYLARDDPLLRNDYKECNSETYNQEVVELFISNRQRERTNATSSFVTRYLEVEVTPQDTLYVAHIRNPYGNGTNKSNVLVDCGVSGIEHHTKVDEHDHAFEALVSVPWALINGHNDGNDDHGHRSGLAAVGDKYVGNFFRVLMQKSVAMCDPDTCAYGAWSPTMMVPPQFHVSTVFGEMYLA